MLGTIDRLYRYPVKSMQGEVVERLDFDESGAAGDRRLGVVEVASGRVLSAKRYPALLEAAATTTDHGVEVALPSGTTFAADDPDVHAALSAWLGAEVGLQAAATDAGGTYVMGVDPVDDDAGTFEFTGPPGTFADLATAHFLSSASLDAAAAFYPEGEWDVRRFRPTALVVGAGAGFAEDGWVGLTIHAGSAAFNVVMPTIRCAMPTRAQPGLRRDADISRTLSRDHGNNLGVYCWVATGGTLTTGDTITAA